MSLLVLLAWYPVKSLAEAKKFYGQTLGLKQKFEMPGWAEFSHAEDGAGIGLAERPESNGGASDSGATVVLGVENLDTKMKELSRRGVRFEGEIGEFPGVVRIATFRDPFGNRLQLVQSLVRS